MTKVQIGNLDIEVTFKGIKNLHLSVHPPDGRVTISSPDFYDLEKVKIYAATKLAWIKKEQEKLRRQKRESGRLYINHESHYLFGNRYLLHLEKATKNSVEVKGKRLILNITDPGNFDLKRSTLYHFYRMELRKKLAGFVQQYAKEMKLHLQAFSIRVMKTKWGSCAQNKQLWFNIELAKKPIDCIEYIVVHEMVHLFERHHNKNFIALMNNFLPGWQIRKKVLNELSLSGTINRSGY